jgi:hypothetical protein
MALLYADILGMKARWRAQTGVQRAYRRLEALVAEALTTLPAGTLVGGGVQTDAVALLLEDPLDAVRVGQALFQAAFDYGNDNNRFWLRGVIMEGGHPNARLAFDRPLPGAPVSLSVRRYSTRLLNAINIEGSGYKGHRLLVESSAVPTPPVISRADGKELRLVWRLKRSLYPSPACDGFSDVLWMVPNDLRSWEPQRIKMLDRLRWSSESPEESLQAAATMLVFAEVEAMIHSLDHPRETPAWLLSKQRRH